MARTHNRVGRLTPKIMKWGVSQQKITNTPGWQTWN